MECGLGWSDPRSVILRTERLVLRELEPDDWQAVHAYRLDPRYQRFYPPARFGEDDARAFVDAQIERQKGEPRTQFQLAITLPDGELIGNCGVRRRELGAHHADMGYELDPKHWRHGYATEAARAILAFGFRELELHRVWAWCVAENTASAHVLEKLGMRLEGRMREVDLLADGWHDQLIYGILRDEWTP